MENERKTGFAPATTMPGDFERTLTRAPFTLSDIQQRSGSFRRMIADYWDGALTVEEEIVIEDKFPRETLVSYRPVVR